MIFLNPEIISGLGEDTFWTWFKRGFPTASFTIPKRLNFDDILLQYSTMGFPQIPGKTVALLWELYPEMREVFKADIWDNKISKVYECAKYCTHRTVSSPLAAKYYKEFGSVDVIPIGVNTDLFRPMNNKISLREKYGLPLDKEIGFWGGTTHPMKGYSRLLEYAKKHPDIYWIIVWKWEMEADHFEGGHNFIKITQEMISDLMNCADFILFTGMLRSYFMLEWEAMACDVPVRLFDETLERDFIPCHNPRDDVFRLKWDRQSTKDLWSTFLEKRGVTW
jgi:glycosyltransferase involved in cell wall biosynthesis